jgi:hypothetical protein
MSNVKVNIGIDAVQLLQSDGSAVPFVTNAQPDVVNLLDLQEKSEDFKGNAPIGVYKGVRVLIDTSSSGVKIGNFSIPIVWPTTAAVQSVDFPVSYAITGIPGPPPTVTLDFNVMHSVRFANGKIYVQPNVVAANAAAQVKGRVQNRAGKPVSSAAVLAIDALGHVVNSTVTDADGDFNLHALPAGFYTIQVKNSYVTALGDTITAVGADANASPSARAVLGPNDNLNVNTLID